MIYPILIILLLTLLKFCFPLQNYFVSNSSQCPQTSICDGSFNNPFAGLISAISQSINLSHQTQDFSLVLHLLSDDYVITNQQLNSLNDNGYVVVYNYTYQLFEKNGNTNKPNYFDNIKMKPFLCSNDSSQFCPTKTIINIKTENFTLIVANTMNIENIIWMGNNLPFSENNPDNSCLNSLDTDCCQSEDLLSLGNTNCSIVGYDVSNRGGIGNYDFYHGLFQYKYSNSTLNVISCGFNYMVSISVDILKGYLFLIGGFVNLAEKYNPKTLSGKYLNVLSLNILNSSFESNYFLNGIIYFSDNVNNNTNVVISNSNFSNYNIYDVVDSYREFNNFIVVVSNSTLNFEFLAILNSSTTIFAYSFNQIYLQNCTLNLVFSTTIYDYLAVVQCFIYNYLEISGFSLNVPSVDYNYEPSLILPNMEEDIRPFYYPSNYALFFFDNNNTLLITESIFQGIQNIGLIDCKNFTNVTLENIQILDIYSIDKYFIQSMFLNTFQINWVVIQNISSSNNAFFAMDSNNSLTINNMIVNTTLNNCLFYADQYDNILISNSSFLNLTAMPYATFLRMFNYNILTFINNVLNTIIGDGSSSCFYALEYNEIFLENSTIMNVLGYEGTVLYMMDYSTLYMTNTNTINCTALLDTIYDGRSYYNNITIDNCSFYGISGTIAEVTFIGYVSLNNVYVNGDGAQDTTVLIAISNCTGYLNNSIVEGCYSESVMGLVYSNSNSSYVYMINNTFFNNLMQRGAILTLETNSFGEIYNCTFINSTALQFGGSIYLEKNNYLIMNQVIFVNSTSLIVAGTIYSYYSNQIEIFNCVFNGSSAEIYGGFIGIGQQTILIINSSIFNSISGVKGGLIFAKTSNNISLFNISMNNCSASIGGIIYLLNFNTMSLISSNFTNTSVLRSGGIVFSFFNNTLSFENSSFLFISSLNLAGGFYLDTSNILKITSCFLLNISSENSGAILYTVLLNQIAFLDSEIINSSLSYGDGAILFDLGISNDLSIYNCLWIGFSCFYDSFAISLESSNTMDVQNSEFNSNVQKAFEGFITADIGNTFSLKKNIISIITDESSSGTFITLMENNSITKGEDLNITINYNLVVCDISSSSIVNFNNTNFNNLSTIQYFAKLAENSTLQLINMKLRLQLNEMIEAINSKIYIINCVFLFQSIGTRTISNFLTIESSEFHSTLSKFINDFNEIQLISSQTSKIFLHKNEFTGFFTSESGSVLSGTDMNIIKISFCLFIMNQALENGGAFFLIIGQSVNVYFFNNIFLSNNAPLNGGAFSIQVSISVSPPTPISLENSGLFVSRSYFILNKAGYGGGVYSGDFILTQLNSSYFKFNKAAISSNSSKRSKGGAIYSSNNPDIESSEFINNQNFFINNEADIGGALFFDNYEILYKEIGLKDYLFQNNIATYYGVNLASSAFEVGFLVSDPKNAKLSDIQQNLSLENAVSVQSYNACLFYIVTIDKFKNIMYNTDEIPPFNLDSLTKTSITNQYIVNFTEGFLCFISFQRNQYPIQAESNYYLNLNQTFIVSNSYLNISFRNCQLGEQLTNDFTCVACPPGKYSLLKNFQSTPTDCFQCQNLAFSCGGGFNLTPNPGYWRFANFSTTFIQCPQVTNCLGGTLVLESYSQKNNEYSRIFNALSEIGDIATSLTGFCALGYTGILCNECDEGYGKVNAFTCLKCYENGYNAWISMQVLIKFALIFGSLFISVDTIVSIFMGDVKESNIKLTNLIKIFLSHIQILIILFTFVDLTDPFNNIIAFSLGFSSNLSEAFNLECLIKYYNWEVSSIYFQFFISFTYWFPLSLFVLIYILILYYKKRKQYLNNPKYEHFKFWNLYFAAFLILLDLCYFDMVNISFKLLNCTNVSDADDPENRLLFDYSVRCDTFFHNSVKYVSLFIVIIGFGLGFPLLLFVYLFYSYKTKRLNGDSCLLKFSYFYYAYQRKYFFWDVLHILKKFLALTIQILLASQITVINNISIQTLLILVLFFLFLQIRLRPYNPERFDVINRLEQYSLISLSLSIYLLLFYQSLVSDQENINLGLVVFFFSLALVANISFACLWFYIYIPEKKREFSNLIFELKRKVEAIVIKHKSTKNCSMETIPNFQQDYHSSKNFIESNTEVKPSIITIFDPLQLNLKQISADQEKNFDLSEFYQIMKINEKFFKESLVEINLKRFHEKNLNYSLVNVSLPQIDYFLHKNWQKQKFVNFLFQDRVSHLYESSEMSVGIEFFDSGGCSFMKKARITLRKGFEDLNFNSLKFKASDRIK